LKTITNQMRWVRCWYFDQLYHSFQCNCNGTKLGRELSSSAKVLVQNLNVGYFYDQ